jgi:hypothetical protein
MSNNKQSSVDYLIEQLLPKALSAEQFYHIQQAKAMHHKEVVDFVEDWYCNGPLLGGGVDVAATIEEHYNETFGEKQ